MNENEYTITFDAAFAEIEGPDLPEAVTQDIMRKLSWMDSGVEYSNQMNKWGKNEDPRRYCYDTDTRTFMSGFIADVYEILLKHNITPIMNPLGNCRNPQRILTLPDSFWVHQREVIAALIDKLRGIAQSPTGSGKSYCAAGYIKQFPTAARVIVTVPSQNLMFAMKNSIEAIVGEEVGTLDGDQGHHWRRITVGVINSLAAHAKRYAKYLDETELLIFDECHRAASAMYQTVSSFCRNAYRRVGLTATPYRNTGDQIVLRGVIGPTAKTVEPDVMVRESIILRPSYITIPCESPGGEYPGAKVKKSKFTNVDIVVYQTANGKPKPLDTYKRAIVENEKRNAMVAALLQVHNTSEVGGPMLVLVKHIAHGEAIQGIMADTFGVDVPFIHGSGSKRKRREILESIRGGHLRHLIASGVLNEGEDIPILEYLVLASGGSNPKNITQQIGRVIRTSPGKRWAVVFDFTDTEPYYQSGNSRRRVRIMEGLYPGCHTEMDLNKAIDLISNRK